MKQGWGKIPFEDSIVKVKYTTKIPSNDYLVQGLYPIVSQEEGLISGYWNEENDVFKISTPVVIFGDHTRILKYVDFDFVLGADGVKILQPIKSIDAKFFKLYLESCKIPSLGYSRHYKLLKELQVPIPPREEQERIVEELDCLSGVIEKKREQLKELDALAQSIFYQMFGDPITNEKGWEVKKLGEVCEDKKKILRASKKCALDDAINYIDISAIDNINNVITIPTPYIFEEAPSRAQQVVQLGDVIVSMVRPNLKNIAIVNCDYDNLIASSGFCVLRARKEMTIPFLFYIVKSDAFTMYLMDRVSGANYPAVRESDITDYITIVPPISLQQEFADKIEAIEKQKELIKKSISETENLFNARMDYYFN